MERKNGRKVNELRPIVAKVGIIKNATGSAFFSLGRTKAIAAVYGPRTLHPKRLSDSNRAVLRTIYSMLPFSTTDRVRPGPSRRSQEICKVTRQALAPAVFLEEYPKSVIDVFINIIQAEAGTRTAGINAASMALADAGIPMRDLVTAVATGKIDNEYVMDLEGKEEEATMCDLPIAYMPRTKKVTLLQMDGDMSQEDVMGSLNLAIEGCKQIYEKQKQALSEGWSR